MPEQLHQGVDADIGVGQLGGEGVAQPVDKCAAGAVGIDAGAAKRPQHPVLQGAAGDALTVGAHKERRRRRPGGQSPAGGGAPFGRGGEAGGPGVEIALEDVDQCRLDGDPAVFAALAADVDDGAVVGAAKVTDVARTSSSARNPASSAVRIRARSRCIQSVRRRGDGSALRAVSRAATASAASALGSVLASLGRPTIGIGFDAINSAVNRNVHNTFQVDQHR